MAFILPTSTTLTHYSMRVSLDGTTFAFEFRWNARDSAWYFDIASDDDVLIASGIKVMVGIPLGTREASLDMPAGMLIAIDTSGAGTMPGVADLGERVLLYYYDAESAFGEAVV